MINYGTRRISEDATAFGYIAWFIPPRQMRAQGLRRGMPWATRAKLSLFLAPSPRAAGEWYHTAYGCEGESTWERRGQQRARMLRSRDRVPAKITPELRPQSARAQVGVAGRPPTQVNRVRRNSARWVVTSEVREQTLRPSKGTGVFLWASARHEGTVRWQTSTSGPRTCPGPTFR